MAKAPTRVELGKQYEDKVTGFVGTAVFRQNTKNACVRVGLQPRIGEDGKMPKTECVFETMLLAIDGEKRVAIDSKPDREVLKLLGKRYVDPKTGFTGVASSHTESFNGHVQLGIESSVKPDGGMGESWNIDLQDLVEVGTQKKVNAPTPERGPLREQLR